MLVFEKGGRHGRIPDGGREILKELLEPADTGCINLDHPDISPRGV